MKRFFATPDDLTLTWLRVTAGFIVLMHGVQKLFGWSGGHGPAAVMESFRKWFGLPPALAMLVILADSPGAFWLVLGLGALHGRGALRGVLGVVVLVQGQRGFCMNRHAERRRAGSEFHLLVPAMTHVLPARSGGRWSLDRLIHRRLDAGSGPAS